MAELDLDDRIDATNEAMDRNRLSLEQMQSKLKKLNYYTKPKTLKELRNEVEKARSNELTKETTYQLEKMKEANLLRQINNCQLFARSDGFVIHANDPTRPAGQWCLKSKSAPQSTNVSTSSVLTTSVHRCRSTRRSPSRSSTASSRGRRPKSSSTRLLAKSSRAP